MPRQLFPVGISIGVGLVVLLHQFVTNAFLDPIGGVLIQWAALIAGFALLLGLFNLLSFHSQRVIRRVENWQWSIVILITSVVVFLIVLPSGGTSPASEWVLRYLYQPLEASFLALLVFFIAAAAYRALRVRSWESTLFVVAALIVLIGAAPLSNALSPMLTSAKDWVMNVPAVAGVRGILIGVALGIILTGLRLLTGLDRPYTE